MVNLFHRHLRIASFGLFYHTCHMQSRYIAVNILTCVKCRKRLKRRKRIILSTDLYILFMITSWFCPWTHALNSCRQLYRRDWGLVFMRGMLACQSNDLTILKCVHCWGLRGLIYLLFTFRFFKSDDSFYRHNSLCICIA